MVMGAGVAEEQEKATEQPAWGWPHFQLEDAPNWADAVAAVRGGAASYAQACEVEAVCVLLERDLTLLRKQASELRTLHRETAMGKALDLLAQRERPRLVYDKDADSIWRIDLHFEARRPEPR